MKEGLNRVTIAGNLAADPELRFTQAGQAILALRVACSESFKKQDGSRGERTEFVSVSLWGKRGEALSRLLSKGDPILVEGRLQTSSYEKNGEKRYRTEVVATNVVLLGGRRQESGGPRRTNAPSLPEPEPAYDEADPF